MLAGLLIRRKIILQATLGVGSRIYLVAEVAWAPHHWFLLGAPSQPWARSQGGVKIRFPGGPQDRGDSSRILQARATLIFGALEEAEHPLSEGLRLVPGSTGTSGCHSGWLVTVMLMHGDPARLAQGFSLRRGGRGRGERTSHCTLYLWAAGGDCLTL